MGKQIKQRCPTRIYSGIATRTLTQVSIALALTVSMAHSEMYIGGQLGTTFFGDNNKLTRVDLTDFTPAGSMSGRDLAGSPVVGAKAGYYFPRARWFGLEMEAYYTTPHIEQQPTRFTVLSGSVLNGFGPFPSVNTTNVLSGDRFRVITVAPFNLMFRYSKTRLQPYVGIGPGIFLARVKTTASGFEGTQSSTRVGLNVKLGGEYFFTRNLSGFGEVRYNYVTLNFDSNDAGAFGFQAIYNPIIFSCGISYHF